MRGDAMPNNIDTPVVPEYITVHLGLPDQPAENVRVPFVAYIKNERDLPELAGKRDTCEYSGADFLRNEPHLHGVLPQPRV